MLYMGNPNFVLAVLPTLAAVVTLYCAFKGPVAGLVAFDIVLKIVSFAFMVYNIQFFFFPAFLVARNFGDRVNLDKYHYFTSRFAGFIGTLAILMFWELPTAAAYKYMCLTTGGVALIGPVLAVLYLEEGPDFMVGPILMTIMGARLRADQCMHVHARACMR